MVVSPVGVQSAHSQKGYAKHRVFFADEAAGYRPCSHCMRDRYKVWKGGGTPETFEFPRKTLPPTKKV